MQEYYGPVKTELKLIHTVGEGDKMISRRNLLTANFVFAVCDNIVVRYSDLESAGITRIRYSARGERNGYRYIVFGVTNEGKRFDIYVTTERSYKQKEKELTEKIFNKIELANPECKIDRNPADEGYTFYSLS